VDTVPGLKELRARKRDLLLESEMNRQAMHVELQAIQVRLSQFQRGYGWARHFWSWGAPVAGLIFARKYQKTASTFAKGSFLVNAAGALWKAWRTFRGNPSRTGPPEAD
jgi:hypothetical protein